MADVKVARTIAEFVAVIDELWQSVGKVPFHASEFLFRGQANASWELLPSIARGHFHVTGREAMYVLTARNRLPGMFPPALSPIDLLGRLQHYGIPTRLLDVTENALAALYFACSDCSAGTADDDAPDGEVVVFRDFGLIMPEDPIAREVARTWQYPNNGSFHVSEVCDALDARRGLDGVPRFASKDDLGGDARYWEWVASRCRRPMFVRASMGAPRQVAQGCRFILFPNQIGDERSGHLLFFMDHIEPLSKDAECVACRIRIPSERKAPLLASLRHLGITGASLFPDSPDAACAEIKRSCDYHLDAVDPVE